MLIQLRLLLGVVGRAGIRLSVSAVAVYAINCRGILTGATNGECK